MIFKPSRGICSSELDEEMCTLYPWPTAQHQDWAALEGGRMRAVVAYAIRLSRRNATARREPGIYSGSPMLVVFFFNGGPSCFEAARDSGSQECDSLPARVQGSLTAGDCAGLI